MDSQWNNRTGYAFHASWQEESFHLDDLPVPRT